MMSLKANNAHRYINILQAVTVEIALTVETVVTVHGDSSDN